MKIVFANAMYAPDIGGGAEVMLQVMVEGAARAGHEVSVLTAHGGAADVTDEVNGIAVHRLKLRNVHWPHSSGHQGAMPRAVWHALDRSNPFMSGPAGRRLRELSPQLIVSHNLSGLSLGVWAEAVSLGIPVVHVLHDYHLLCPRSTRFRKGRNCEAVCASCQVFRGPHRQASRGVQAVVGVSQAILDTHLQAGLFDGVPRQLVIGNARQQPEPAARPPRDGQRPVVLGYIGGLTDVKGVRPLIEALKHWAVSLPPFELLVAGRGEPAFEAELRQLASGAPIRFLGHVSPFAFFAQIDVAIAPSVWHDPLPGVVYEAIGQNVPVIGSRRGGIPEIIQEGVNGHVYDPDDPEQLRAILQRVLSRTDELAGPSHGRSLRETVAPWLDEAGMLARYERLYADVVGPVHGR
jgi:glycosyltransferase involved in cell wall biosynthesis